MLWLFWQIFKWLSTILKIIRKNPTLRNDVTIQKHFVKEKSVLEREEKNKHLLYIICDYRNKTRL